MTLPKYIKFLPVDMITAFRRLWMNHICASSAVPRGLRIILYRMAGHSVGRANIYPSVTFLGGAKISIGHNAMINSGVTIDNTATISIEEFAHIGPCVFLGTSSHAIGDQQQRASPQTTHKPIQIERGAWIQAGAIVLPGVTVGQGAVIAAGAVVTRDCAPNTFNVGIPARPQVPPPWTTSVAAESDDPFAGEHRS